MLGNEVAYGGNLSVLESTLKQRRCDIRWRAIEETVDAEKEKKRAEAVSQQIVSRLGCLATRDGDASFPINQK